ncbi:uncharacterized protein LOC110710506 isoform X5 [Chenopodium quinoa]|uniref:uncharacterized protein LOC110710506 isoform X5 n=1 Tax=Chenopodium quinoa TaxID=63459 RepID=UPI000B79A0C0|nr:uncharacterized protein LOC110710506 isoform X5 [Chenopodium quinoa]
MAHSSVSEEWKRQFKKQGKKDEHEVVKKVISDGHSSQKLNHARFPVLDEDLISERGQALDRDYGGGTRLTINHLKSNVMQSNIGRVPNYDTPASSTDHPSQMLSLVFGRMKVKPVTIDGLAMFGRALRIWS